KKSRVSRNQIYAGFSVPQLLNTRYRLTTTDNEATAIAIERDLHFYFTGGWYHFFNQDAFIEISTWAKYVNGAPFNLDLNVRLQPSPAFWAGVGYNSSQAIHLEAGLNIADYLGTDSNLQIGFSFDGSFKAFNYDLGPTYEFLVATQLATR
ncbi:MAG: type IX secretion system membrane protein PorP/SprF, partial [Bacteroidota bacterium]